MSLAQYLAGSMNGIPMPGNAQSPTGLSFGQSGGAVSGNMMTIGDFITDTNLSSFTPTSGTMSTSTTIGIFGPNMDYLGCGLAGNFRLVRSAGIFGQTSDQIANRFYNDVCCQGYGLPLGNVIRILAGTNDYLNATNPQVDRTLANIEFMIDTAFRNGFLPIVYTIFPRSDMQAQLAQIRIFNQAVNTGLVAMCARKKCPLVDTWAALQNGSGGYNPAYTTDGIHLSNAGQIAAANAIAAVLQNLPFSQIPLGGTNNVPYDGMGQYPLNSLGLVSNLLVTTASGPGTYADTMFQNSSGTAGFTVQNDTVEPGGSPTGFQPYWAEDANWVHMSVTTGAVTRSCQIDIFGAGNPIKYQGNGAYMAPGDVIECSFKFHCANLNNAKAFFTWGTFGDQSSQASPFAINSSASPPHEMIISNWFQVGMGATNQLQLAGGILLQSEDNINPFAGDIWATRVTARNLTQLGLVNKDNNVINVYAPTGIAATYFYNSEQYIPGSTYLINGINTDCTMNLYPFSFGQGPLTVMRSPLDNSAHKVKVATPTGYIFNDGTTSKSLTQAQSHTFIGFGTIYMITSSGTGV